MPFTVQPHGIMLPTDSSDSNAEETADLEEILDRLSEADEKVRFEAVEMLSDYRSESETERKISLLVETLGDESPRVRFKAAQTLGETASESVFTRDIDQDALGEAVDTLVETADDDSVGVRGGSVTALGEFTQFDPSFEERITRAAVGRLDDEYPQVRADSVDTLRSVARTLSYDEGDHLPLLERISEAVAERLTDEDRDVRSGAESVFETIYEVGPEARSVVVSTLLTLATDRDAETRRAAASGLGSVVTTATVRTEDLTAFEENLDELIGLVLDADSQVRQNGVSLFRSLAREKAVLEADVIEEITAYVEAESPATRSRAVSALASLSKGSSENGERAFESVTAAVEDPDPEVREQALVALEEIGNNDTELGKRAVSAASDALDDPDPDVRKRAVRSLGELGEVGRLDDLDPSVTKVATDRLVEHSDEDAAVRREVVAALGSLGDQRSVREESTREELRKRAVRSLGERASASDGEVRSEAVFHIYTILRSDAAAASAVPIGPILSVEAESDDSDTSREATLVLREVAREEPSKFENVDANSEEYLG